jgi:hypothetical protein
LLDPLPSTVFSSGAGPGLEIEGDEEQPEGDEAGEGQSG